MDNNKIQSHKMAGYASTLQYPEIKVMAPNIYYAELLMDDYAGLVSELTAINQYLYHDFMLPNNSAELAKLFENTAIVEMLHLEILAETIKLLGGNPIYRGSYNTQNNYWNGSFVYYGTTLCDRLKADLDSEYKAINNYQRDINNIKDPHVQEILKRIILDEEIHVMLFKQALEKYCNIQ